MQRVRIGLTGLAFVFMLVLLAAVFTSPTDEEPITANSIEQQMKGRGAEAEPAAPALRHALDEAGQGQLRWL